MVSGLILTGNGSTYENPILNQLFGSTLKAVLQGRLMSWQTGLLQTLES